MRAETYTSTRSSHLIAGAAAGAAALCCQKFSSRRARLALPPRARRFGAAGAILLLTVSTPHASSEALPTSPDVASCEDATLAAVLP